MSAIARQFFRQLKLNGTHFVCSKGFACSISSLKCNYQDFAQSSIGLGLGFGFEAKGIGLKLQSKCTTIIIVKDDGRPRGISYLQIRGKHTKKKTEHLDSSDDEEEQMEWKKDQSLSDKDCRIVKIVSNSLRTDLLVKAGLGIARNKVESLFYDSKIRVNGEKIFKKSSQLKVGDEIDIIRGPSPLNDDFILVSRIEIMSSIAREDGALNVHLRTFKSLTIENYEAN